MGRRIVTLAVAAIALIALAAAPAQAISRDHVVVAGGEQLLRGQVADNIVVLDGPVRIAGRVTGNVVSVHGPVTISGTVDGTVTSVSKQVRLLPGARIGGDLVYGGSHPQIAPGALVEGDVSHEGWTGFGTTGFEWVLRLVWWVTATASTLAVGLALVLLFPRVAEAAWETATGRTGETAAWAAALFIGLPLAAIVALATIFGIPLGIGLILAVLPLAAVGYVTSCFALGRVLLRRTDALVPAFLAGWGVLRLLALVPVLGTLAWIAASAFGLAMLLLAAWYASHPPHSAFPQPRSVPRPDAVGGPRS